MVVVRRKEGNELMERMPAGGGEDAEVRGGAMVGSAVVGNGGKGTWELLKEGHVILAPLIIESTLNLTGKLVNSRQLAFVILTFSYFLLVFPLALGSAGNLLTLICQIPISPRFSFLSLIINLKIPVRV